MKLQGENDSLIVHFANLPQIFTLITSGYADIDRLNSLSVKHRRRRNGVATGQFSLLYLDTPNLTRLMDVIMGAPTLDAGYGARGTWMILRRST